MSGFRVREHGASILVAALSSAFGVALLQVTGALAYAISQSDGAASSGTIATVLSSLAAVFIVIAVYVGAIVTANTFAAIVAGRTRTIALKRLIGASASQERRAIAGEGLIVGIIGSLIGLLVGGVVSAGGVALAVARDLLPPLAYPVIEPVVLVPVIGIVLTTWVASWVGARSVLQVSAIAAISSSSGGSEAPAEPTPVSSMAVTVVSIAGVALLAAGVAIGQVSPLGVLVGVVGGILSFSMVIVGAPVLIPRVLRSVGRMTGSSVASHLAAQNAARYPRRTARTTIGLVIGVTLVTMFAVAASTVQQIVARVDGLDPASFAQVQQEMAAVIAVFSALIGFSAVIAGVGMVNALSVSVGQRTREFGLLRAVGFSASHLRSMIRLESAHYTIAAVLLGLGLGIAYGWAGAEATLGSEGIVPPVVPLWVLGAVTAGTALLTVVSSLTPARRAGRITPIEALAVE